MDVAGAIGAEAGYSVEGWARRGGRSRWARARLTVYQNNREQPDLSADGFRRDGAPGPHDYGNRRGGPCV
jgi:hypothetical protein